MTGTDRDREYRDRDGQRERETHRDREMHRERERQKQRGIGGRERVRERERAYQEVCGFQVSVNDSFMMQPVQTTSDIFGETQNLADLQLLALFGREREDRSEK